MPIFSHLIFSEILYNCLDILPSGSYCLNVLESENLCLKDFESARGYGDLKKRVAEIVIDELTPIRNKYEELISDTSQLDKMLKVGAEKANDLASNKLKSVKDKMGLLFP